MDGIYGTHSVTLPLEWLTAIATSDVRLAVHALRDLYGITRFSHLVAMATFVGMVVILDLRGLGLFPAAALDLARPLLVSVLKWSFWMTIVTGVFLFLRDPVGVGLHTMFLPKLVLVTAGYLYAHSVRRLPVMRRRAGLQRAGATVSLTIWLLVIGASTWNHVERPERVGDAMRLHNLGK